MTIKNAIEQLLHNRIARHFDKFSEFEQQKFINGIAQLVAEQADKRNFSDHTRHQLLYHIQRRLYPKFVIADEGRVLLQDELFRDFFKRFSDENWTSYERKWNLKEFLKQTQHLTGDYAECGVFRGGSAFLMCEQASQLNRQVHLFDSFEGLSTPKDNEDFHWSEGDLAISEEEVRKNLQKFDNFQTYKGWIPERFDEVKGSQFSFIHIDVDLEQPTADSIAFFFPRLCTGGILLLDDHGSAMCPGARSAALTYFEDRDEQVLDLATGQGLVIKQSS